MNIKKFKQFHSINEAESDGTQDQIDTITNTFQIYQTNKSKIDALTSRFKSKPESDISEMEEEFSKIVDKLENTDLIRKYYLSKKLEVKKIKLEEEVKQIMVELNKNQKEISDMMNRIK